MTAHSIVVSESGVVDGSFVARTVALRGRLDGDITCEAAHLHSGSQVTGRIAYRALTIESGAKVEARFLMQEAVADD